MTSHLTGRKLAPLDDIWGKILDFRLHKFKVMSILKECGTFLYNMRPLAEISNTRMNLESLGRNTTYIINQCHLLHLETTSSHAIVHKENSNTFFCTEIQNNKGLSTNYVDT